MGVTLAHRGILMLEEFPEFPRSALDRLRQPPEDGVITVTCSMESMTYFSALVRRPATCDHQSCKRAGAPRQQGRACLENGPVAIESKDWRQRGRFSAAYPIESVMRLRTSALLAGLLIFAGVGPAWASPPNAYGWWWKAQPDAAVTVPPPPTVPQGGLYVAADPSGATAVSALRFDVVRGAIPRTLLLRVSSAQGTPALRACRASSSWSRAQGGPYSASPTIDCTASTAGAASRDGSSFSFSVGSLSRNGQVDVVVLPAVGATAFQVAFQAPPADTLDVVSAPPTTRETSRRQSESEAAPRFNGSQNRIAIGSAPGSSPEAQPARAGAFESPSSIQAFEPSRSAVPPYRNANPRSGTALSLLLLVAMTLGYHQLRRVPVRQPHLLGGSAQTQTQVGVDVVVQVPPRGIGRFARPREGRPPTV
jgi:hypothetical protein